MMSEVANLIRTIEFIPAYDKRNPDPAKNYGVHGVNMRWLLKGPAGAIQFVTYTNWQLPHVSKEIYRSPFCASLHLPLAADIGYHSPTPIYEGQSLMDGECDVLGGQCYYDGSSLQAQDFLDLLIAEGHEAVWKQMEGRYLATFERSAE